MTLENAIDRYLAARKELEAARKILLENAPYKVGDKVRIRFQTISIPAFVTEVNISDWNNADDLFHFVVRLPTKGGAFSDRTPVDVPVSAGRCLTFRYRLPILSTYTTQPRRQDGSHCL